MRHLFSSLYWFAFLLLLILLSGFLWSISTPQGSRWLVFRLLQTNSEHIAVSGLRGSLIGHPQIESLAYENNRIRVRGKGIQLDYQLGSWQQKELLINTLRVQKLTIYLKETKTHPPEKKLTIPEISLPLKLHVKELAIQELILIQSGKAPLTLHNVQLDGTLEKSQLTLQKLAFSAREFHLNTHGSVALAAPQTIHLKTVIKHHKSSSARLDLHGPLSNYQLSGDVTIREPHPLFPLQASIRATGDLEHLSIQTLKAALLKGNMIANGKIDWHKGLHIAVSFSGKEIDPGSFDPQYPGKISFGGQAKLNGLKINTQFAVLGKVRQFPFQTETDADIDIGQQQINIRSGHLLLGQNSLRFTGKINRKSARNLHFTLDAPQLSTVYSALEGALKGQGSIQGKWRSPEIKLNLTGKALHFKEYRVHHISLELNSEQPSDNIRINLKAAAIKRKKLAIGQLQFQGLVNQRQQHGIVKLTIPASKASAQLKFAGGFQPQQHRWQGHLDDARATAFNLPEYRQKASTELRITSNTLSLSNFCLAAGKEQFCANAGLDRKQTSSASVTVNHFAIKHLSQWIPPTRLFKESLNATIALEGSSQRYSLSSSIKLDNQPLLQGKLAIEPISRALRGKVDGEFSKLGWVSLLSDDVLNPKGKLVSHITIGGTLSQPQVNGYAELKQASVQIPPAGIRLHDIAIKVISSDGKSARLKGSLMSDKGKLNVKGDIDWSSLQNTHVSINLTGKDFEAANLPHAHVLVSPDLQIISYQKQTTVSGFIKIPEADIRFAKIPQGAIHPSPDTYFIDDPRKTNTSRLKVYSQINIELGKKVHLSGFGLDAGLSGKLRITETPDKPVSGDGSFKVVDGVYQALGQKLSIERGEIYFNGPLNTPGVNLRVTRTDNGVTSGLTITGPIQQPESRIFSDPPMDDTNALSYLLTGKPLGATGGSDSNMLLNAVARLGIKGSAGLIDDLRTRTGLDTLAIKPGQDLEQSEVVIGKYLSPRLYLEYTSHLFEDSSILSMQYKLNKHLQLKAESGDETQSIDLIYQIEK